MTLSSRSRSNTTRLGLIEMRIRRLKAGTIAILFLVGVLFQSIASAGLLRLAPVRVFLDEDDLVDADEIERRVHDSMCTLVYLSRGYFASRTSLREVRRLLPRHCRDTFETLPRQYFGPS